MLKSFAILLQKEYLLTMLSILSGTSTNLQHMLQNMTFPSSFGGHHSQRVMKSKDAILVNATSQRLASFRNIQELKLLCFTGHLSWPVMYLFQDIVSPSITSQYGFLFLRPWAKRGGEVGKILSRDLGFYSRWEGRSSYKKGRDACQKVSNEPLKGTNLGVANKQNFTPKRYQSET